MDRKTFNICLLLVVLILITGCASTQRPVLYPNEYLKSVGKAQAEKDIDQAFKAAENYGIKKTDNSKHATRTVAGTLAGGGTGLAVGAISGNPAVGAISGATGGLISSLFAWVYNGGKITPLFKNFVNRYLKEKGYDVIGWE